MVILLSACQGRRLVVMLLLHACRAEDVGPRWWRFGEFAPDLNTGETSVSDILPLRYYDPGHGEDRQ